ncbi:MAG: sulfotransferase, partial [Candidatus Zixiibacteriota bacterium]
IYILYAVQPSNQKKCQQGEFNETASQTGRVWIKPSQLIDDVRNLIREKLPEYMVPHAFILLENLPLMPNGKLDRRALPEPSKSRPELSQAYVEPRTELENRLAKKWCEILKLEKVGIDDRFFELGGDSIQAGLFINELQKELGEFIYIATLFEAPTIAEYAAFLQKNYTEAVARWLGERRGPISESDNKKVAYKKTRRVDESMIKQMQAFIPSFLPLEKSEGMEEIKNPQAIFILAPPRSGTTLLRVMLAGNPRLFAAPELQLLGFNTLRERKAAFTGKFSGWLEGTLRSIMEIKCCDADQAKQIMQHYEEEKYTTKEFYRVLQNWIGDRILVDKSPSYALDLEILKKAERDFESAFYIHLVRHPYAMIRSFESMHMDQVLFLGDHPFSTRELGELVWIISHQNILEFLKAIPQNRQFLMRFEDLTQRPQDTIKTMCKALNLEFHPEMLEPYRNIEKKMTDGIYAASTPMGDIKFRDHKGINPMVAERWKQVSTDNFLGDITWEVARVFGYEVPDETEKGEDYLDVSNEKSQASARLERMRRRRERRNRMRKSKS